MWRGDFRLGALSIGAESNCERAWLSLLSLIGETQDATPQHLSLKIKLDAFPSGRIPDAEALATAGAELFMSSHTRDLQFFQLNDELLFLQPGTALVRVDQKTANISALLIGESEEIADAMEWAFEFAFMFSMRWFGLYFLHGSFLNTPKGHRIYLLGPSGRGKTTLSLYLIGHGYRAISDNWNLLGVTEAGEPASFGIRRFFSATKQTQGLFRSWLNSESRVAGIPGTAKTAYRLAYPEASQEMQHIGCDAIIYISKGPTEACTTWIGPYPREEMFDRLREESTTIGFLVERPLAAGPLPHGFRWHSLTDPGVLISAPSFEGQARALHALTRSATTLELINGRALADVNDAALARMIDAVVAGETINSHWTP